MPDLLQRLNSALAGRYRIERELGRGGMATVFLAYDFRHQRRVAIKVLDPKIGGVIDPERFIREIQTVANLTHPHILPLHDSGEAGGLLFFVMPYVEGESLRKRLLRETQLSLDEAVRITREVADALEYAHRAGVVHRDIKPENVLLVAGHAVVADFGVARAIGAVDSQRLTMTGVVVGTAAYVSPEQAGGAGSLDGRSDEYSLGCMLYELLSGQPPFTGPSAASIVYQHLSVAARPVTDLRPGVPGPVRDAVAKALAKLPADRYATVAEFARALAVPDAEPGTAMAELAPTTELPAAPAPGRRDRRALVAAAVALAAVAVAVVLWRSLGSKPLPGPVKKDWILVAAFDSAPADSITAAASRELVSAAIDQSRTVGAVPRERILQALVAAGKPPRTRVDAELARELAVRSGVRTVLEGQIGRVGPGYSIVLRLVNADSANVILTETGTAKSEDALIPALGDLAKRLRRGLGENRAAVAATRSMTLVATPSFEAYRLYLRARQLAATGNNLQVLATYRAALALDPDFAMAWANMAYPYFNLGKIDSVVLTCDEALRRSHRLTAGARAQIQALRSTADGDVEGAARIYDTTLLEDPDDLGALNATSADLMWSLGRYEDALDRMRRLQNLRAFPVENDYLNEAWTLCCLGRFDEARRVADKVHGVWRTSLAAKIAMSAGDYAAAESLVTPQRKDPRQQVENVGGAELNLASICRARGRIAELDSIEAGFWKVAESPDYGWDDKPSQYRLQMEFRVLCLRRQPPPRVAWPETTVVALSTRGLRSAYLGDLDDARRCLRVANRRPRRERTPETSILPLLEATIDEAEGRWGDAAARLQPIAARRYAIGRGSAQQMAWIRWTLADAYERLGMPDSAAAHLERITRDPLAMEFRPYASLRLVPLYARLGRGADARRQWALASQAFKEPDPPISLRMNESRAALARL